MPALSSWLTEPLWDQCAALLAYRSEFDPSCPLGCHRRRVSDRTVFHKLQSILYGSAREHGSSLEVGESVRDIALIDQLVLVEVIVIVIVEAVEVILNELHMVVLHRDLADQ